jgi:LacI family transcriptional regulator
VHVPGDISVVGFDDIPEAEFMIPPLTTIRQDFDEVGRRSIALLLRLVATDDGAPPTVDPVAPVLVSRRSTAGPRAG